MTHDLIVVGAGPAGMAAAATAAGFGIRTALLDEQAQPGGQIYRNVTTASPAVAAILGADYQHGRQLAEAVATLPVDRMFGTTVWDIAPDLAVTALQNGHSVQLRAPQIIAATGAAERASPMPGWTLPGVLNAGAAQIALKSGGSVPSGRIILVGGGPLLLLVACQLLTAGADVGGIVETAPRANAFRALSHLPRALLAADMLAKGLRMMLKLRLARIPWFVAAHDLAIEGAQRVEALTFTSAGRRRRLQADAVLLHHGVAPNTQISRLLRVQHDWDETQQAWQPRCDAFGETSLAGLRIVGDGAAIAGAIAAEQTGRLAALGTAWALGRISLTERDRLAAPIRRVLDGQMHARPFLDALYRPPAWITAPTGNTVVCRCEEITAQEIADTVKLGSLGPNQSKFFSRCGMGPCQGRICGLPVTGILARELGVSPAAVGSYRIRAPLKPVPLSAIAKLGPAELSRPEMVDTFEE